MDYVSFEGLNFGPPH